MTRKIVTTLALIAALGLPAIAQTTTTNAGPALVEQNPDSAAPVLTDTQKMQLMLVVKEVQLQQQAAQLATYAAERAQQQLQQLIASMTPPGYTMNEKMELVKIPEPKKEGGD